MPVRWPLLTSYVLFRVIVFALEAGLYCRFLKRVSPKKENGDFVLYSFIANCIILGRILSCDSITGNLLK